VLGLLPNRPVIVLSDHHKQDQLMADGSGLSETSIRLALAGRS
jgi:hypothetical protein